MYVKELIEILKKQPPDISVTFVIDGEILEVIEPGFCEVNLVLKPNGYSVVYFHIHVKE